MPLRTLYPSAAADAASRSDTDTLNSFGNRYAGQIIKLSCYNKPVKLGVTISKIGNKEVMPANAMRYDFSNIGSC